MRHGATALAALAVVAASCGQGGVAAAPVRSYVAAVEPIRLGVNRLLEDADPILTAWREHRMTDEQAGTAMGALERRFARYTVDVFAVELPDSTLAAIHRPYAHTYVLEDAYLSALVSGLASGDVSGLPDTQAAQRAAIIEWRTRLEVLARSTRAHLPADLQRAGRGEIAPKVTGGS